MPVSSSTEHWIKPDALTINLNHFGDPDYLQVSVLAGAVVMAFKQDVIGYNAAHNYRTWPLDAANTYLETSSSYNVYARLTRSEVNARALVVYDTVLRDIEGREISYAEDGSEVLGDANPDYFFVFLGQISASVNSNGESVQREWIADFRFGNLNTNQYQNEEAGGEWTKMFRLNKVTDLIDVLKTISSFVVNKITVAKSFILGGIAVDDIYTSEDIQETEGDESLVTSKYVRDYTQNKFLRKDKDDRTPYNLGIGGDLKVDGSLAVDGGAKIKEETELDEVVINKNIHSKDFISGFLDGQGWAIRIKEYLNAAGVVEKKSLAEFDDLIVRGSMRVIEFIVSQMLGENDNRIFTGMMEVDHYDSEDGKIYLKTDGGKLYNPFRQDDIIIVQQYGGMPSEENGYYITKQYEFIVTEVGIGNIDDGEDRLDWIRFRNFTTAMEGGDLSLITERDTLVRIDNLSDSARKGIIQIMSVGEYTPYMDIVYGAKTDPENSLKGRFGNISGVYNPLFGWLRDFGAYLTNLYAVGEFRIAHTGEDVADALEVTKGAFRTNYRQTTYDMTEEQNFFTNAAFTNDAEHWVLSEEETGYFLVDGLPQYFNHDLYASENTFAGVASFNERDMLRLCSGNVKQLNALIKKPSTHMEYSGENTQTEVVDTTYLNIRVYCVADSTIECGFVNSSGTFYNNVFHVTRELESNIDAYTISVSGKWDGNGDFLIKSSGDVYIDLLSFTDKPLENFKIETSTRIEQDATRIALLGQRVSGVEGSVTNLGIELNAAEERITLYVDKEISGVEESVSQLQIDVNGILATVQKVKFDSSGNVSNISTSGLVLESDFASLFSTQVNSQGVVKTAQLDAYVLETELGSLVSKIEISADQIDLTGVVTYSMLNSSLQTTLDGKATNKALTDAQNNLNNAIANLNTTLSAQIDNKATLASVESLTSKVNGLNNELSNYAKNSELGALAKKDLVEAALCGSTLIVNGYLNTDYCKVKTIEAIKGTIGGFDITTKDIMNNNNDANIYIRNTNDWSTASKIAGIGTFVQVWPSSTGLSAMGAFVDEEVGDASNIALVVSAKNAMNNIGLWMLGGSIAGMAEKVGHYSSSGVISRSDNVAVANGSSITLPVMNDYDDGHVVTIINNYTSSTNIYCSGNNFIMNGSSKVAAMSVSALSVAKFVYIANFKYDFPVGTKYGCWVKII